MSQTLSKELACGGTCFGMGVIKYNTGCKHFLNVNPLNMKRSPLI